RRRGRQPIASSGFRLAGFVARPRSLAAGFAGACRPATGAVGFRRRGRAVGGVYRRQGCALPAGAHGEIAGAPGTPGGRRPGRQGGTAWGTESRAESQGARAGAGTSTGAGSSGSQGASTLRLIYLSNEKTNDAAVYGRIVEFVKRGGRLIIGVGRESEIPMLN